MTTLESLQASVDQLARAQVRLIVQHRAFIAPLTDDNPSAADAFAIGAFGSAGSGAGGVRGRAILGAGVAILGGVSFGEEGYEDVSAGDAVSAAAALRYAPAGATGLVVEIGGAFAHVGRLTLTRVYANGAGEATGQGVASADLTSARVGLGWRFDAGAQGRLAVFAEYGIGWLSLAPYVEPLSNANPFEAHVAGGEASLAIGKLGVRYTRALAARWDLDLTLGAARDFDIRDAIIASIPGVGPLPGRIPAATTWAEYDARVAYEITGHVRASLFLDGIAGAGPIGSAAHAGVDLALTF